MEEDIAGIVCKTNTLLETMGIVKQENELMRLVTIPSQYDFSK